MSSNKRKSPPNKFEENQTSSVSRSKDDVSSSQLYEDRLQDPGNSHSQRHPTKTNPRKQSSGLVDEEFVGSGGLVGTGPMESGDEMSDLGSYCSRTSSDAEECDGLVGSLGSGSSLGGKLNGRCGVRRSMNCRESTSGESSSAKSPTFLTNPNHNDSKNSKKSMDDVLRKLSSRFSAANESTPGASFPPAFSIENR